MDIQNISVFLSIGIVGVVASLITEAITNLAKTSPLQSKFTAVGIALIVGTGYFFAAQTVWWSTVLAVLAISSTVYSLFFNSNTPVPTPPVA